LAIDRIAAEWDKLLLKGKVIARGIDFLAQCQWLPEELKDIPMDPLDRIPIYRTGLEKDDRILALTVLCHTLSKEKIGSCLERTYRLNGLTEIITVLTSYLPELSGYQTKPDGAVRRLALAVKNTDLLLRAAECCYPAQKSLWDDLRKRAENLQILHTPPTPFLQGRDLLQYGIKPGREMGQLLQTAFDAQLDGHFMDHASAQLWLQNKLK
jgi:tRNA nucleotidyltransferase (CCA-adding enzyme)